MYYLLLPDLESRSRLIAELRRVGIHAVFHYVPLHASDAGRRYGRQPAISAVTEDASERLVRLPLWPGMTDETSSGWSTQSIRLCDTDRRQIVGPRSV